MYDEYVERWKCLIDGVEEFCAWCLSDFLYQDKQTLEGCTGETVMVASAVGFYNQPELGKDLVRLAYVFCKKDLQRALMILEKVIVDYNTENKYGISSNIK